MEKTHWKKVVSDPNFLGEGDFQEGEEKILTIDHVNASETVTTAEGKSKKAVLYWQETGVKPMILNVARSKNIEKVVGSGYFEDWPGHSIQLYIEHGIKAFGEVVSAVRVRPYKPRVQKQERPVRTADRRSPLPWEKMPAGLPAIPSSITVFPSARLVLRSERKLRPLRKRSRKLKPLRKCSRNSILSTSRSIRRPGRCCDVPTCCYG